jgi:TPR repeat protein
MMNGALLIRSSGGDTRRHRLGRSLVALSGKAAGSGLLRATLLAGMAAAVLAGCVPARPGQPAAQLPVEQGRTPVTARDYYDLGRAYETGNGVPMDLARAVELFREASQRGEPRASERLGLLAARGDIVLDDARTYDRLVAASLRDSESATLELARLQLTGAQGAPRMPEAAIASLEQLAADHDPGAMVDLARVHTDPQYGRIDYARAAELLQEANARGRPDAALELARIYGTAGSPLYNRQQTRTWAQAAIDRGLPGGWLVLGSLVADPAGPEFDPAAARDAYQRAIDGGVPDARLAMAKLQEATGETEVALATYQQLVAEGQADVGYDVGRILDDFYPERRGEAYAYYESSYAAGREAAPRRLLNLLEDNVEDPDGDRGPALAIVRAWADTADDPEVNYRLGRILENGPSELRDGQQALAYFRLAAEDGQADAALHAARMLSQSGGASAASGYYRQAASLGDRDALFELGRLQEAQGDLAAAAQSFTSAANAGHDDAAVRLARIAMENPELVDGPGTTQALERAAAGGNPGAMLALADVLIASGGAEDQARALELYRQAAESGNATAMRRLGDLAEEGVGGMSVAEAGALFEQALLAGDDRAAYRVLRHAARNGQSAADFERAIEFTTPAAEAGDPTVAYWYGVVLIKLNRPEEAAEWLISAHSQGVTGAFEELLSLVEDNPGLGAQLEDRIQQAAATGSGCESGRYALIQADQVGEGGGDGSTLYRQALEAGWYVAAERLGRLHMTGLGSGTPDLETAYAYFQIASTAGIPEAATAAADLSSALSEDQLAAATGLQADLAQNLPAPCTD